jgi:hypothetical protein
MELRQVFTTPDGAQFDTKAEAMDYLRRPKILAALKALTAGNEELAEWLLENQETVECAFDTGTIRRVTKSEYAKLDKALEALKEIEGNAKIAFLQEHTAAIRESFRWPSVKRMNDEEKLAAAHTTLTEAAENEEDILEINWKQSVAQKYTEVGSKLNIIAKSDEKYIILVNGRKNFILIKQVDILY